MNRQPSISLSDAILCQYYRSYIFNGHAWDATLLRVDGKERVLLFVAILWKE
jgi:hypothetical protein